MAEETVPKEKLEWWIYWHNELTEHMKRLHQTIETYMDSDKKWLENYFKLSQYAENLEKLLDQHNIEWRKETDNGKQARIKTEERENYIQSS